jgi:hypothetical protein
VSPDDDHGPSAVDTSADRVIRIPEAEQRPAEQRPAEQRPTERLPAAPPKREPVGSPIVTRSGAPWIVAFVLVLMAALGLFMIVLAPRDAPAPPTVAAVPGVTIAGGAGEPLTPLAGTALALQTPDALRTHTVNAGGDNDLLALSQSGLGSVSRFDGAPVTADGVTVDTAFSDTVFSVTSPTGGELVVLVPYTVGTRDLLVLAENEEVVFNGTLMPVPDDLSGFIGPEAAAVAARTGSYIVAVPENIRVIPADDGSLVA